MGFAERKFFMKDIPQKPQQEEVVRPHHDFIALMQDGIIDAIMADKRRYCFTAGEPFDVSLEELENLRGRFAAKGWYLEYDDMSDLDGSVVFTWS